MTAVSTGDRPTAVYGPSGCGKSSLALAGVVPVVREAGYTVLVVDAGHISSLRHALATRLYELHLRERERVGGPAPVDSAEQVGSLLGKDRFADVLDRVLGSAGHRVLVVLDQAEALLDRSEAELAEAAGLLFRQEQPEGIRVLLTLRSDFMDAALSHTVLGPVLKGGTGVPLTPMSAAQLAKVIGEPVGRLPAVAYDPGLEDLILKDAGAAPGILPLLGFVLTQLWERQASGRLRLATYKEIGGVSGALARHAEAAWQECVRPEEEAEALRLLTGLVRVLPGSEAPCAA